MPGMCQHSTDYKGKSSNKKGSSLSNSRNVQTNDSQSYQAEKYVRLPYNPIQQMQAETNAPLTNFSPLVIASTDAEFNIRHEAEMEEEKTKLRLRNQAKRIQKFRKQLLQRVSSIEKEKKIIYVENNKKTGQEKKHLFHTKFVKEHAKVGNMTLNSSDQLPLHREILKVRKMVDHARKHLLCHAIQKENLNSTLNNASKEADQGCIETSCRFVDKEIMSHCHSNEKSSISLTKDEKAEINNTIRKVYMNEERNREKKTQQKRPSCKTKTLNDVHIFRSKIVMVNDNKRIPVVKYERDTITPASPSRTTPIGIIVTPSHLASGQEEYDKNTETPLVLLQKQLQSLRHTTVGNKELDTK